MHARISAAASPHPRGWTPGRGGVGGDGRGFPAPAGMDRTRRRWKGRTNRLPRTRGDGPRLRFPAAIDNVASPHPRGWTPLRRRCVRQVEGFPAPAGMDPVGGRCTGGRPRLPRTRGDGPMRHEPDASRAGASPHPRGWTRRRRRPLRGCRGFPAPAGMDPHRSSWRMSLRGLPRTRGDGPWHVWLASEPAPASPHPRGWTQGRRPRAAPATGFPAPAGMDPSRCRPTYHRRRLPRTRGDGGFPAPAGMDPTRCPRRGRDAGLPRTRGDGPAFKRTDTELVEASPHPRGWTPAAPPAPDQSAGFPAPAGMDPRYRARAAAPPRLPRTRGDGPHGAMGSRGPCRASPHPRGWTRDERAAGQGQRGFPAPAGMDPV